MTVNFISESEFFAKDHGVHTAYLTIARMVKDQGEQVFKNSNHQSDITHVHTIGPYSLYKLKTANKSVVSAHVVPDSFVGSLKGVKHWLGLSKKYLRFFYNQADMVLAVAPKVKKQLEELGVKSRIEVFPNPVDDTHFKKDKELRSKGRKLLGIDEKKFVLISVGQIQPRKGVADFIELAMLFPGLEFIWVGSRPFKSLTADDEHMEDLLHNPPPNFHVKGPYTYAQMPVVYNASDALLFPSFQENAPMGVIEAASVGLPLILRDIPEYELLYGKGYISAGGKERFKDAIEKLLNNKSYYQQMSDESLILSKAFTSEALGAKLVRLYKTLI